MQYFSMSTIAKNIKKEDKMRSLRKAIVFLVIIGLIAAVNVTAGKSEVVEKFEAKELVKLNTVSGDCIIEKNDANEIEVTVESKYFPPDNFEPKIKERKHVLRLTEKIYGSGSGQITWTIRVPDGTEVEFTTASGELTITDFKGVFIANTASGNIEIENCQGEFNINTASGDIDAVGVIIEEESTFASASGSVNVKLAESSRFDLTVGSASGRAVLDYNGNPVKGYFEFTAKERGGRISAPFDFDDSEEFRKYNDWYVRKSFTKESDKPHITIGTSSGRAALKE